jgi:hypothetical protein
VNARACAGLGGRLARRPYRRCDTPIGRLPATSRARISSARA